MKVTCISIALYRPGLTRGKVYQVIESKNGMYRIIADNGSKVRIQSYAFVPGEQKIPMVKEWRFDNDGLNDMVGLSINFSDGSWRWCLVSTPQKLLNHFNSQPKMDPPGFNIRHLLILKTLETEHVEALIRHLESTNQLEGVTLESNDPTMPLLAAQ